MVTPSYIRKSDQPSASMKGWFSIKTFFTVVPTAKKKLRACIHGSAFEPCSLRMHTLPPVSNAPAEMPWITHNIISSAS